jgi:hypothetical protein
MLKWRSLSLVLASLSLVIAPPSAVAQKPARLDVVVARFAGPLELGVNVATVLSLSIWRTLLRPPEGADAVRSAVVYWPDRSSVPITTPQAAARTRASMVLWGAAQHYGGSVMVDSYLSTPERGEAHRSRWAVQIGDAEAVLWLPREVYHVGSTELPTNLVRYYQSGSALRVCEGKTPGCAGPMIGPGMTARKHEGEWSLIERNDGLVGWVQQPGLDGLASAVRPFVGGFVAYYRGQFPYAAVQWRQAARAPGATATLKHDAMVLARLAEARTPGRTPPACNADTRLPEAFLVSVAVMDWLDIAQRNSGNNRRAAALAARRCLDSHADYFEGNDKWMLSARSVIAEAAR